MKKYRPYTQSRRQMTSVDTRGLSKEKPLRSAVKGRSKRAGRNSMGRITVRHKGGGVKRKYRIVDFKRTDKMNVPAKVETVEYDPNRGAFIMRVLLRDGERRYMLAPADIKVGNEIITSEKAPLSLGNRMQLKNIPVGYGVYNVELQPGRGGQIIRGAGTQAQVLAHEGGYTHIKLPSSEVRKVLSRNFATIGQVSNSELNRVVVGKAGRKRKMGIRPTVRGSAMNPVDHPYGGGEGKTQRGTKRPKDKWGNITGGRKTRKKNKASSRLIVKRRKSKRKR